MAADGEPPTTSGRPLTSLVSEAKEGRLTVRMDLEKFVYIDRDCNFFKLQIQQIQTIMDQISQQDHWGLGEDHQADGDRDLVSAKTMVARWRQKAKGAQNGNSVHEVLGAHWKTIDDFQTLFRTAREKITGIETDAAAQYKQLESTLPQQNPPAQKWLGAGLSFDF
ncbi:hypothetical protein [Nocardia sp. BMG51109]|uniref:hypothetical protein n=1 Tax=Nocardia sp. BMG51109 TaxID=1056816 RepID=UPI0004650F1D|nr:hypothetical protein [Nocardia sp. BMG51109]